MKIKNIIAIVLCAVMVLFLAACGQTDSGENAKETAAPEYVYASSFLDVDTEERGYINFVLAAEEGFYCYVNTVVGQRELEEGEVLSYEGQLDINEQRLHLMGMDGTLTLLDGYEAVPTAESEEGHYSYSDPSALIKDGEGFLEIVRVGESWNDAPEDVDKDSEEYYNYFVNEEHYYIRRLAANGAILSSAELDTQSITDNEGYFYVEGGVLTNDGKLLLNGGSGLYLFNADSGAMERKVEGIDYCQALVRLNDGRVAAVYYGMNGQLFSVIENGSVGETIKSGSNNLYQAQDGRGDYLYFYTDGSSFYGFRADSQESEKLFSWINCDVDADRLSTMYVSGDCSVHAVENRWSGGESNTSLVTVERVPYDSLPEKEVLTLATLNLDWGAREQIINFNRKHENARIEVIDYSEYNTEDDDSAGLTKLTTELVAGQMPDILDLNRLPVDRLSAKGMLSDLYPLMDESGDLDRDDFFPSLLKALEYDGKLYHIPTSFYIFTMTGASDIVGSTPGWTYRDVKTALNKMPEGASVFGPYVSRESALQLCLYIDSGYFADWESGQVRFDSREFLDLLDFTMMLPKSEDINYMDYEGVSETELIASGRQMLTTDSMSDFTEMFYYQYIFGGDIDDFTFVGAPCSEGVGNAFVFNNSWAITRDCSNKELAWEFLSSILSEEAQSGDNIYNFPVNKKAFDAKLKEAMTPQYEMDENGNYRLDPETGERIEVSRGGMGWGNGESVEFYAITQEMADKLMELIDTTDRVVTENDEISNIVLEQVQAFYSGDKSAEEVAKLIQDKVSIYINEQR